MDYIENSEKYNFKKDTTELERYLLERLKAGIVLKVDVPNMYYPRRMDTTFFIDKVFEKIKNIK